MKKLLILLIFPLILTSCTPKKSNISTESRSSDSKLKGVWISCYELTFSDKSETGFTTKINQMFSDIKGKGFNAVFVHVRSHCDAYYKSNYFPYSSFISEKQGVNPGYDPLKIMCYFAKIYKLQIHAWINPFRISTTDDISILSTDNPALKYIKADSGEVKKTNIGYYFNPAYESVRKLIVKGVEEIAKNYTVDGMHFDDYFYPTTDASFDKKEYSDYKKNNNSSTTLEDFRRDNVNKLIKEVYNISHKYGKTFGISPHCSFYYNYNVQYGDVEKWCNEDGYIDYIAPQIYFDFTTKETTEDNQPLSFKGCLEYWLNKTKNNTVYIGLALYKSGTEGEWAESNNIIARQIKYLNSKSTNGFIIFSYSYLSKNKEETENIIKAIKTS